MDKITHEVRLANWTRIIEQCQARPAGQSAKKWLADNGINEKQYYYWLRKLRQKACSEQLGGTQLPAVSENKTSEIAFAEIPFRPDASGTAEEAFHPAAVIKTATASVAFSNDVSPQLLSEVLQGVMRHA